MKKKLMMVAVLLGALSLGACVDDNESQSVTDVRNAKTEQLKSIAALNNAEAQAKLIAANAEAELLKAQAALHQANADKAAAEAKIKELEAKLKEESYSAELEAALKKAEADKAAAEYEIAQNQANMERLVLRLSKDLAVLQNQLLQAQKDLEDKKDAIADAKLFELNEVAKKYAGFLIDYADAEIAIANKKADISGMEADLKDWNMLIAADIAAKELVKEQYKLQIAALKNYTNYSADGVDALKLKVTELEQAFKVAQDNYKPIAAAYSSMDIDKLKEEKNIQALEDAYKNTNLYKLYNHQLNYSYLVSSLVNPIIDFSSKSFKIADTESDIVYYIPSRDSLNLELAYADTREFSVAIDGQIANLNIAALKEAIDKADTGYKAVYDAAVKATATAKAAYEAAKDDAQKKTDYENALAAENQAKSNYEDAVDYLEDAQEAEKDLKLILALVTDPKTGEDFVAAVKAYNEAIVAIYTDKANAYFAMKKAKKVVDEAQAEYNTTYQLAYASGTYGYQMRISLYELLYGHRTDIFADNVEYAGWGSFDWGSIDLNTLLNTFIYLNVVVDGSTPMGAVTIDEAIKMIESYIAVTEDEIVALKDTTTQEQTIAQYKAELEGMQMSLKVLKAHIDAVKAKLDAALADAEK